MQVKAIWWTNTCIRLVNHTNFLQTTPVSSLKNLIHERTGLLPCKQVLKCQAPKSHGHHCSKDCLLDDDQMMLCQCPLEDKATIRLERFPGWHIYVRMVDGNTTMITLDKPKVQHSTQSACRCWIGIMVFFLLMWSLWSTDICSPLKKNVTPRAHRAAEGRLWRLDTPLVTLYIYSSGLIYLHVHCYFCSKTTKPPPPPPPSPPPPTTINNSNNDNNSYNNSNNYANNNN